MHDSDDDKDEKDDIDAVKRQNCGIVNTGKLEMGFAVNAFGIKPKVDSESEQIEKSKHDHYEFKEKKKTLSDSQSEDEEDSGKKSSGRLIKIKKRKTL